MNKKVKSEYKGICDRIVKIREDRSMTQNDFAAALGVTRASISAIEAAYYTPSYSLIRTIHEKFGVPYDYIIDGKSGINPNKELITMQEAYEKLKEDYDILLTAYKSKKN